MAANLVQKGIIDVIVTAYVEKSNNVAPKGTGLIGVPQAAQDEAREICTKLGQMLWDVNYNAYNNRYKEENEMPTYVFEPIVIGWPERVLVIIDMYEAEISEADEEHLIFAERHCNALRAKLVRKLKVYRECEKEIRQKYR